ncbi:MAG: branched-chain amino acid transport system substrate-binding protein [Pseudomonadales bacterium]|jgi:branched-chain amino acid transport system substrate-binding protein
MKISRRDLLKATGAGVVTSAFPFQQAMAGDTIKLGSVLDNSGNLDIYGKPMVLANKLAVAEINAAGGLLGKQIELIQYDTQSDIALYTKFAQQLSRRDKVDVVQGGITSASREAVRQTFRRSDTLYFYNTLYEGGVCDRNIVCTGSTPAQANEPLVEAAMEKWGKKVYILAADYNYGHITAKWLTHYVGERGGEVAATSFFPLDVADFGSTIAKIQQEKPDWVVSALVGGAHMSFYRQWAASGMNKNIPLASTTFGAGNEQGALSASEGDGIMVAHNYSQELDTPANKEFLKKWEAAHGDTSVIHELAVAQYQGVLLWAEAVRKAGSLDREAMLGALESGISIEGPSGTVTLDAQTHHAALDIQLMEVKDQKLNIISTSKQRPPADTARYCDLAKDPDSNVQYEVNI